MGEADASRAVDEKHRRRFADTRSKREFPRLTDGDEAHGWALVERHVGERIRDDVGRLVARSAQATREHEDDAARVEARHEGGVGEPPRRCEARALA